MNADDPKYGDIHFYNGNANGWSDNTYKIPRCATEFGYQSLPTKSTLLNAIGTDDWNYQVYRIRSN